MRATTTFPRPPFAAPARAALRALAALALGAGAVGAQGGGGAPPPELATAGAPGEKASRARFFDSDAPLHLTLTADFRRLRRDRGDKPPYRPATLTYAGEGGGAVTVPLRVRTRGIWRRKNCDIPPLWLNFTKDSVKHTLFAGQDRQKLVPHCRNFDDYEQYVLGEYNLYRVYRLLTPMSHGVRLAKMTYADSAAGKTLASRWAILLEDPEDMAARTGTMVFKEKGAHGYDLDPAQTALFGLFQYLIGNTDFAVPVLHNVELLRRDSTYEVYPVAYDFDFAGAIAARYALPDPKLPIRDVRQRLYRGFCVPEEVLAAAVRRFEESKPAIYALYRDSVGTLLEPSRVRSTLEYFDEFYRILGDPRALRERVSQACLRD